MFLHLILFVSLFGLGALVSSYHPEGWRPGFHNLFFFLVCIYSAYRFTIGYLLFDKTVKQGWNISFFEFAWRIEETGLHREHPIPIMEEFKATPFYDEKRTIWQNFKEALLLARGWDMEARMWRELVPVFTPQIAGTEEFIGELLKAEDIKVFYSSSSALEGAYGAKNLQRKTIFVPMAQFEEAREFIAEYYDNNPDELEGLANSSTT